MLEKRKRIGQVEIQDDGVIFLKEYNEILDDGKVISSVPHRSVYYPDMELDQVPDAVKPYAQLKWSNEVKQAYELKKQESNKPLSEKLK
jgi:hypothetical protein